MILLTQRSLRILQACIIAVYCFGIVTLMARNFNEKEFSSYIVSGYVPLLPSIQVILASLNTVVIVTLISFLSFYCSNKFFVYLTWLNFGRAAVNPFGNDEEDIDVKEFVECHIEV